MCRGTWAGLVLLASCSGVPQHWENPARHGDAFYADRAECTAMSSGGGTPQIIPSTPYAPSTPNYTQPSNPLSSFSQGYNTVTALQSRSRRSNIFSDCMKGKGYRLVDGPNPEEPDN